MPNGPLAANIAEKFIDHGLVDQAALGAALNACFEFGDFLSTNCVHYATEFLDLLTQPCKFFLAYAVMLRISRLYISFFQLLEPSAISAKFTRPAVNQAHIKTFGLRS